MKFLATAAALVALAVAPVGAAAVPHATYTKLYKAAIVGKSKIAIVKSWPRPIYQNYHDGTGNHCFEWIERGPNKSVGLYDLCFSKKGILASKQKP
jgi:hypothetical protein